MKITAFEYVGEPVPALDWREHGDFLILLEKSILLSLENRKLISPSERELCLTELARLHSEDTGKQRTQGKL